MNNSLKFLVLVAIILSCLLNVIGCSETDEDETTFYEYLVGDYELESISYKSGKSTGIFGEARYGYRAWWKSAAVHGKMIISPDQEIYLEIQLAPKYKMLMTLDEDAELNISSSDENLLRLFKKLYDPPVILSGMLECARDTSTMIITDKTTNLVTHKDYRYNDLKGAIHITKRTEDSLIVEVWNKIEK